MSADLRPPVRPPTGGPSLARFHQKQWWSDVGGRIQAALARIVAEDALDRRPAAIVAGPDAATWTAWLEVREVVTNRVQFELSVTVDALAPLSVVEGRDVFGDLFGRTVPGGRLLLIERVVSLPGRPTVGLYELLRTVVMATGGAVTLHDLASVQRPGDPCRTTAVIELVRLATPKD